MFAYWHRHPLFAHLRARLNSSRSTHPLARIFGAVLGFLLIALLFVTGIFIGLVMLLATPLLRGLRRTRQPSPASDVIEGEFRHAQRTQLPDSNKS